MDCKTAEKMVSRYIRHALPPDLLEEFLEHIKSCPSCKEELETYFMVHKAIQLLDNEEDSDLDFGQALDKDLRMARKFLRKKKTENYMQIAAAAGLILVLGILIVVLVMLLL